MELCLLTWSDENRIQNRSQNTGVFCEQETECQKAAEVKDFGNKVLCCWATYIPSYLKARQQCRIVHPAKVLFLLRSKFLLRSTRCGFGIEDKEAVAPPCPWSVCSGTRYGGSITRLRPSCTPGLGQRLDAPESPSS